MKETELKRMSLTIAGRSYPVKVEEDEIEVMRQVEKEINEKLNKLQLSYSGKDVRDYMSLALISYEYEKREKKTSENLKSLQDQLTQIESLLD